MKGAHEVGVSTSPRSGNLYKSHDISSILVLQTILDSWAAVKEGALPGAAVKVLHVKSLQSTATREPWQGNCIAVDLPSAACSINFYSVMQPSTLLERPQVGDIAYLA